MSIWDLITISGTSATILGVFLTFYALINNRTLRREGQAIREILNRMDERQQEARKEMAEALKRIAELIVVEGDRTREAISSK